MYITLVKNESCTMYITLVKNESCTIYITLVKNESCTMYITLVKNESCTMYTCSWPRTMYIITLVKKSFNNEIKVWMLASVVCSWDWHRQKKVAIKPVI